jgi:N-dimethylarginine dimethylaminohydrolase
MVAPLRRVIVKRPEEAFQSDIQIAAQWRELNYLRAPDLAGAKREHEELVRLLKSAGADVLLLPSDSRTGLDSIYVHDPVLVTDSGAVILQVGKPARQGEGPAFEDALKAWDVAILGRIEGPATAEAGDMVWLDSKTLAIGHGLRTNATGIEALRDLLAPLAIEIVEVALPYWNGPDEVLHLMSLISLLAEDLAVVYRRLLPVGFLELLVQRGMELIDIDEREFDTMACNVLALSPRNVAMVRGNPLTRSRLEKAGCSVSEFGGVDLCFPGSGGPTCLTRPLFRSHA